MQADRLLRQVAIVADDLTGALDAGLQFAVRGLDTRVSLGLTPQPEAEVMVLNADSRAAALPEAVARVQQAAAACAGRQVYKKLDSTMRGHLGPECVALRDALGLDVAVIAPAFAAAGRTVERGQLLVDGAPVHRTALANDPQWPARTADVVAIAQRGVSEAVALIPLSVVRGDPSLLAEALAAARLAVVEAVQAGDLARIAQAIVFGGLAALPCGSAGLAAAWADALQLAGAHHLAYHGRRGPVLVVTGSRNAATLAQLEALRTTGAVAWCELTPPTSPAAAAEAGLAARAALASGSDAVLSASLGAMVPDGAAAIAANLGRAAHMALSAGQELAGLVLTGGDTALQVSRAVAIEALSIVAAIEPGIPGSRVVGGAHRGLAVVTKAGGFGSRHALLSAVDWIRNGNVR